VRRADNLTTLKSGSLNLLEPYGPGSTVVDSRALQKEALTGSVLGTGIVRQPQVRYKYSATLAQWDPRFDMGMGKCKI
jgi:hypothetical protein